MRGCFKFDENPAVVSLRYWIFSLVHAKVSRMYGSEYGAFYARRRPVWQSHESRQYNQMVKTVFLSIILVLQTYILWSRTVQLEKQVTRRVTWLSVVSKSGNAPPRLALRQFSFEHFQTQNYAAALRSKIHSRGWRNLSKGSLKLFLSGAAQESWVIFESDSLPTDIGLEQPACPAGNAKIGALYPTRHSARIISRSCRWQALALWVSFITTSSNTN